MIVVSSSSRYIEMKWMLQSSWSGGGGGGGYNISSEIKLCRPSSNSLHPLNSMNVLG